MFKNLQFQQQKVMHRKSITPQLKYLKQTIVKIVVDKYRVVQTQKNLGTFYFLVKLEGLNTYEDVNKKYMI